MKVNKIENNRWRKKKQKRTLLLFLLCSVFFLIFPIQSKIKTKKNRTNYFIFYLITERIWCLKQLLQKKIPQIKNIQLKDNDNRLIHLKYMGQLQKIKLIFDDKIK